MGKDDLRWLYRDEDDSDRTRQMSSEEAASLDRGAYPDPPQQQYPQQPYPQQGYQQPPYPQQQYQPQYQPGPPGGPPPPPPKKKRRRRRRRPFLRFVMTVIVLWLIFMIGTPIYAWTQISTLDSASSSLEDQPGTAVLLVGSDGRGDLTPEQQRELGTGSTDGQRTDTIMLLYQPPTGKSVLLSFPRDSYVEIPGHGSNKINAAYAFGGHQLLIDTVEHNTGIQIDGYMEIGMLGLVDMVDAVGGVEVCPEQPMQDRDAHIDIPAGCQELDGVTALGYARMRKADPRGDLGRVERQREVISQIVKRAASPMTIINPVQYWGLNMGAAKTLHRTPETGIPTMFGAGVALIANFTGAGISMTVPISNPNAQTSAGSSVLWDEAASQEVFDSIAAGDTGPLEKYHK